MANLFNLDIDQVIHNGDEVILMVLNGSTIYEKEISAFKVEYTVRAIDEYINKVNTGTGLCSGLPTIYTDETTYSYDYEKIEITKIDGTKVNHADVKCNEISKVTVWYSRDTYKIRFRPRTSDSSTSVIKEINYCDTSNFVSMSSMLHNCPSLSAINNMNKWKTKSVTDMSYMLYNCYSLTELDLSSFNTSNVTNMASMFYNCYSLESLDVSGFDTSSVEIIANMFGNCKKLVTLNLSNFDTSKVISAGSMFENCSSLTTLDLSNFDLSKLISSPSNMFENCTSLHTLRLDNCDNHTLKMIINYGDLPTNIISGVTRTIYCKKSQISGVIKPENWIFSYVYEETEEPDIPEEEIPLYVVGEFEKTKVVEVRTMVNSSHTDLSEMFFNCLYLESVNTQDWDTSNVTTMRWMFEGCVQLDSLDLSRFNTSNVTNMEAMFCDCASLTELDVSSFDTGNVTNMAWMFENCNDLTELDVSNFDTSNVTSMYAMFRDCEKLTTLDLSNFDTSRLCEASDMFYNCTSLTELDLSNFNLDPDNIISAPIGMLENCNNLHTLRLDNCDNFTLQSIINWGDLPTSAIDGVTRTIYCKESQMDEVIKPENWVFSYVYEEPEIPEEPEVPEEPEIPEEPETEYYIVYTVDNNSSKLLNELDSNNTYCYGLPRIYTGKGVYSYDGYKKIEITKIDGSITTDTATPCNNVSQVKLWYPETTYAIKFLGSVSFIPEVKTIKLYNVPNISDASSMFSYCNKLTALDLSSWDISSFTGTYNLLFMLNCTALIDLQSPKKISTSIDLSACPNLTHNSIMSVINNLVDFGNRQGPTLTLGKTNGNKLSSSNIQAAKSKGWTVYY